MYYIIVSRTNGDMELVQLDDWHLELATIHELLHDGFFEVVAPVMLGRTDFSDCRMLVDDCGLLKDLPVNKLATGLYGSPFDVVVGDVIFCTTIPQKTEDEPDIYAFSEDDANLLFPFLERLSNKLQAVEI